MRSPARGRRSRRSRAADPAGWARGGVVERHLRLVALEGDAYPAPRRPVDDMPRGADWLGDRLEGDLTIGEAAGRAAPEAGREAGRSGRAGRGPGVDIRVTDARPASRMADRSVGAPAPWADAADHPSGSPAGRGAVRTERRAAGPARASRRPADGTRQPAWRAATPTSGLEGRAGEAERQVERRPVRLTRRGRLVMLALVLFLGALVGFLVASPGQAADPPKPAVTAVVQPGDTLWSFSERNLPGWRPQAAVVELKRLNDLEGYVIHPGQRLVLPARR